MADNLWEKWKEEARALGISEARRYARVSWANAHKCHECFCCAAWEYVREYEEEQRKQARDLALGR